MPRRLRVLRTPNDDVLVDMKRWGGKGLDPEAFDIEKVNKKLGVIGRQFEK